MMDVKAMRKIAEAATPGEWIFRDRRGSAISSNNLELVPVEAWPFSVSVAAPPFALGADGFVGVSEANSKFIAIFNPEAVTELLDALEAAQAENKQLGITVSSLIAAVEAAQARIKELEADVVRRESERNEIGAKVDELYMMLAYRDTQPPEQESE